MNRFYFIYAMLSYGTGNPLLFRDQLPFLANYFRLCGEGAEVGVREGIFSDKILQNSNLSKLYSIDIWIEGPETHYNITRERLKVYGERSTILTMSSPEASKLFEANSLDFVFIDADHSYEAVKKDIESWWSKAKTIFAGHDYHYSGIKKAVDEHARKYNLKLYVTPSFIYTTKYEEPCWYFIKGREPKIFPFPLTLFTRKIWSFYKLLTSGTVRRGFIARIFEKK